MIYYMLKVLKFEIGQCYLILQVKGFSKSPNLHK